MPTNFLIILMDDMGWKDIACAGSTFYETPVIDDLRRKGMFFDNAYASCPVCSPSRASMLTGKYPATLGVTDWIDLDGWYHPCMGKLIDAPYIKHIPEGEVTIAQALRDNGYQTWHVGKWHLGEERFYPQHVGFDVNIGGCSWGHPHEGYFSPYHIENLPDGQAGEFLTDRLTDEAICLLKERDTAKPFFLNLWYYDVHIPIQAKNQDIQYFQEKYKRMGLDKQQTFEEGEHFPTVQKRDQRITRRLLQSDPVYAAMILNVDRNIGRLLDAMQQCGVMDDTLIIFTSDNGGLATSEGSPTCNAPASQGKGWMYEGGVRVPLIACWKDKIPPNSSCDVPVTSTDFYPTMLQAGGLPPVPAQHCDGLSILSCMTESVPDAELRKRPLFWHYPHYGNQGGTPGASVRLGDYKLLLFFEGNRTELYNITQDIEEQNDLTLQLPEKSKELLNILQRWLAQVAAKIPEENMRL